LVALLKHRDARGFLVDPTGRILDVWERL